MPRRLFSNGRCPYYRRRQAAGGDGSDHDCCGAEQSPTPGFSSTVWRPAPPVGGHLPAVATLRRHTLARWSEAVDVPSDIVQLSICPPTATRQGSSPRSDSLRRRVLLCSCGCSFSNLLSARDALNCTNAARLTGCPARVVSPSCPIFLGRI